MKGKKGIVFAVIAAASILVIAFAVAVVSGRNTWYKKDTVTDAYRFPTHKSLEGKTYEQTIECYQIPEDVLKTMSTEGLIESCLDYPLFWTGMVFSNESAYAGFMQTRNEFNGLQELFRRKDAADKLVRAYIDATPEKVKKGDDSPTLRMRYFQYILAQEEVLEGLSSDGRRLLLDECVKKLEQYSKGYRDSFASDPVLMVAARICQRDSEAFRELMLEETWIEELVSNGMLLAGHEDGVRRAIDAVKEYRRGE
ncbi:MAG: hypothetical protein II871_01935 [Clostridia bacterium]|nr:hypothetical protein [Clostridia bacterium]